MNVQLQWEETKKENNALLHEVNDLGLQTPGKNKANVS